MSMVFNATFNNISVISWRSILFVEETGVLGKNSKKDSKYNGEKRKDENTNYGHGQQSTEKIKQIEQH